MGTSSLLRRVSRSLLLLLVAATPLGCSPPPPPLSSSTALACPVPGPLPFRLQSSGFRDADNRALVSTETRNKDEASDTLGLPDGALANLYLGDDQAPAPGPIVYRGKKARTAPNQGLFADGLPGERVSLWRYDDAAWRLLGRGTTDADGVYTIEPSPPVAAGGPPVYAVLEADGSCAVHYDDRLPAGTRVVVSDIDGTLTLADSELIRQISDESYTPAMMTAANTLLQTWAHKGYTIVYLTARNHVFRAESRAWLEQLGFPPGPLLTTATASGDPAPYKAAWLKRMIDDFGWQVVAAYGNAETDIEAYAAAGIPTDITFIIGPNGGHGGTVAIPDDDYTEHIASFVDGQPSAS